MMSALLEDERVADLLVQQATEGLSASETLELRGLLAQHGRPDPEIIERTAAAILLAGSVQPEPLPESLRLKLEVAADAFVAAEFGHRRAANREPTEPVRHEVAPSTAHGSKAGWYAAAAGLLLAIIGWWPRLDSPPTVTQEAQESPPSAAEARQQLLASGATTQQAWQATEDPAARGLTGDVVWNNERQSGYMRFRGLAANDPGQVQYQLWIFDASRGDQYPVDGGVFNVPAGADEVVVPIDPKLPVSEPHLFAVTVEKPGGVVVSSRERIVALADTSKS
ncbi:MAG TPA: anti-sigma factor [Steroidobacteraceae bacterium]|nr:anti-sigma factor [Steroidobacteraceae bacterium]